MSEPTSRMSREYERMMRKPKKGEFENGKTFCEGLLLSFEFENGKTRRYCYRCRAKGEHNKWGEVPPDCVANENATLSHAWKLALTAQCRLGIRL